MNIKNPVETADQEFKASKFVTENLAEIIRNQELNYDNYDEEAALKRVKDAKVVEIKKGATPHPP